MSELREAAQAAPDAELRNQHKAFAHWYFGLRGINEANFNPEDLAWAAWKAALSAPDDAEPVAWRKQDGAITDSGYEASCWRDKGYDVRPLYAHPPRDEWREAVLDELVTTWTFTDKNKDDPRLALRDIINWHVRIALDPAVSSDAQALIEQGKAMRDVQPPTEGA